MSRVDRSGQHAASNRDLGMRLLLSAVVMFGFGYLLIPFYEKFCEVTGINNLLNADRAPVNSQVDPSRQVALQLDANVHHMQWRFRPLQQSVRVHPGELVRVDYEISNLSDHDITGQAVPSYGPREAGQYFSKLECFCFEQQTLVRGETRIMPVVFVVDPHLPGDIATVTLSYTFFEVAGRGNGQSASAQNAPQPSAREAAPGRGAQAGPA